MRKKTAISSAFAVVVLLAGCTSDVWVKGGVSAKQANADLRACAETGGGLGYVENPPGSEVTGTLALGSGLEQAAFEKCMMGKGYKREK